MTDSNVVQFVPQPKRPPFLGGVLLDDKNQNSRHRDHLNVADNADTAPSDYVAPPWDAA